MTTSDTARDPRTENALFTITSLERLFEAGPLDGNLTLDVGRWRPQVRLYDSTATDRERVLTALFMPREPSTQVVPYLDPPGRTFTATTWRDDQGVEVVAYGPTFTRQARRTATRTDVLSAVA